MPASKLALDFLEFCGREHDVALIAERFIQTLRAFGYEHIACASHVDPLRPRPGAVSIVTYPMPWQEQYSHCGYAYIDPVFLAARAMSGPFNWSEVLGLMRLNARQQRLLAEGASHGVEGGLTIPLRTPDVMPASCSLVAGPNGIDPLYTGDTLMVVIYGHGAMHRRLNPEALVKPIVLPRRERECLALAGRGKSDWTIGQLLGVSERTVHNSIERAKKRYGVAYRAQAIMRAAFDGQISVDDLAD